MDTLFHREGRVKGDEVGGRTGQEVMGGEGRSRSFWQSGTSEPVMLRSYLLFN